MEEKGLGVYAYFKAEGHDFTPKELAKALAKIRESKLKKRKIIEDDSKILKIIKELGLELDTVRSWLDFLSVPQEILTMELSRPIEVF